MRIRNKNKDKYKNKAILIIVLFVLFTPIQILAKDAIGWHWYNEIFSSSDKNKEKKADEANKPTELNKNSATTQVTHLRQTVEEAKAKAILYPTEENMRSYLILQNLVMAKASAFTRIWKKTLLDYPELDYSILHPTQNSAQHIIYEEIRKKEDEAIKLLSQKFGLLFFYRGANPLDQELAPTIESFCQENNISLIPISVDGAKLEIFSASRTNTGQAEKLGVKHFPALILVDPKNQKVLPLNYGSISASDLRKRFLQVLTNFQDGV